MMKKHMAACLFATAFAAAPAFAQTTAPGASSPTDRPAASELVHGMLERGQGLDDGLAEKPMQRIREQPEQRDGERQQAQD